MHFLVSGNKKEEEELLGLDLVAIFACGFGEKIPMIFVGF